MVMGVEEQVRLIQLAGMKALLRLVDMAIDGPDPRLRRSARRSVEKMEPHLAAAGLQMPVRWKEEG